MAIDSTSSARSAERTSSPDGAAAARDCGCSAETTQELRDAMDAVSPTELADEAARVAANDETADGFETETPRSHTVVPGDTLSHIARAHGASLASVIEANPQIANPNRIYPGDRITLPAPPRPEAAPRPEAPATPPGWAPAPADGVLARGMAGAPVEAMQRRLEALGYDTGPIDGRFGRLTEGALEQFQQQNELDPSGRLDENTRARLASSEAQPYQPSTNPVPELAVYPPGSAEQIALFEEAARRVGVPEAWARDPGLINILQRESAGRVGVPNYTYGERSRDPAQWAGVHAELQEGRITARSSATGLGQLLLSNVDRHYPSGRAGIGDPVEEAAGMLSYISERYGDPATAWARYGTVHEGY